MVKIIFAMQKAPLLTQEAFADSYRKEYLTFLIQHYKTFIGCISDLTDNRPLNPNHMGPHFNRSPYDGITALYFRGLEEFLKYHTLHSQNDSLMISEKRIIRLSHIYAVDEIVHWDHINDRKEGDYSPGLKIIPFSCRSPRMSKKEFNEHYREVHSLLAREHHPGIGRYVQNFVQATLTAETPEIDAIAELHFPSFEDYRDRFYARAESPKIIGKDVLSSADLAKLHYLVSKELISKNPD